MHSRRLFFLLTMALARGDWPAGDWPGRTLGRAERLLQRSAVAKVGEKVVDLSLVDFPAMVKEEKGEWVWLGRAWMKKSDCMNVDEALAYYSEAVRRNPKSPAALRRRAACWTGEDDQEKAMKDLNEAIRLDPKDAKSMHARGKCGWSLRSSMRSSDRSMVWATTSRAPFWVECLAHHLRHRKK